jgi:hypothetical protein
MNCREARVRDHEEEQSLTIPSCQVAIPRHGLAWLPYLWSRVFFPGQDPPVGSLRLRSLALLIVLPSLLLYGALSFHLFEPDEGRYAEIPREMLIRGEWIIPYLQGEPYLDKPPLLYWLVRLSYTVFGVHDWTARLVPALAIHATILLAYFFGRRWLGEACAFTGSLILALAPGFVTIGRLLTMDGLLSVWVALSLCAGYEAIRGERFRTSWWLLAALSCGLGVLTKGPVAIVLSLPPLCLSCWLAGSRLRVGLRAMAGYFAVVLAMSLPWYIAICLRLPAFAYHFLWEHNVVRFLAPFDHLRPIWFYLPILLIGLLPATLLIVPFTRFLLSGRDEVARLRSSCFGFVLLAGGWCVLFFSLSGCKLPTYILPALPFIALGLGTFLARTAWGTSPWPKRAAGLAFALLFAGHNIAIPWYAGYRGPLGRLPELAECCRRKECPVFCYPRSCDSVSFYVERDDLRTFRSKETHLLIYEVQTRGRTVVLFTHRHSLAGLRHALPADLQITGVMHLGLGELPGVPTSIMPKLRWMMGETALGLCDVAIVEKRSEGHSTTAEQITRAETLTPIRHHGTQRSHGK